MKQEIIEALALELTKTKIAGFDPRVTNTEDPNLWVEIYLQSEKAIRESYKEGLPVKEKIEVQVIPISNNW